VESFFDVLKAFDEEDAATRSQGSSSLEAGSLAQKCKTQPAMSVDEALVQGAKLKSMLDEELRRESLVLSQQQAVQSSSSSDMLADTWLGTQPPPCQPTEVDSSSTEADEASGKLAAVEVSDDEELDFYGRPIENAKFIERVRKEEAAKAASIAQADRIYRIQNAAHLEKMEEQARRFEKEQQLEIMIWQAADEKLGLRVSHRLKEMREEARRQMCSLNKFGVVEEQDRFDFWRELVRRCWALAGYKNLSCRHKRTQQQMIVWKELSVNAELHTSNDKRWAVWCKQEIRVLTQQMRAEAKKSRQ
jgi:hypothetical protein